MNILIVKLGATGDVVRTTPLLQRLTGHVTWITADKNVILLRGLSDELTVFSWEERHSFAATPYDLVINLEDTLEVALFANGLSARQRFGAYVDAENHLAYTDDSRRWFDLSLISRFGRDQADKLKLQNRQTYQELVFDGLGFAFAGEKYLLPDPIDTGLLGDVAIAADSGPVWPMKKWAYYKELKQQLEDCGLTVNVLPERPSLLEHLGDVKNHRCLVGGDSLPMHFALGMGRRCVTLFTCTSPWEIFDYGLQRKIVSPRLEEFFYKRGYDERATTSISVEQVMADVVDQLGLANSLPRQIAAK